MEPTLAVDIGGSKILAALVDGSQILESDTAATSRDGGPDDWIAQAEGLASRWRGRFHRIGVTATGVVSAGLWSAMNTLTLNIPKGYPLARRVKSVFGREATLCNDAQAAAWGEHLLGAGNRRDTVFLTISTGVGGGAVINGKLLQGRSGMAGHFGQLLSDAGSILEDAASGNWIAAEAQRRGHPLGTPDVFTAAAQGEAWADEVINLSAAHVARLCYNLQLLFDPTVIVVGGGVGLAPGYLQKVEAMLEALPQHASPSLAPAALGKNAGVLGIAALANFDDNSRRIDT